MNIRFSKMHGAGNDFLVIDDRDGHFPVEDKAWLARVGARRTGVGCDGFVLLRPSERADLAMLFLNPDGSRAGMCGNGSRCVARFAFERGLAGRRMTIAADAGILRAEAGDGVYRVQLTPPTDWRMARTLAWQGEVIPYHYVNTGVPHCIVRVEHIEEADVPVRGGAIRHHPDFAPEGTNVDFVAVTGRDSLRVRTYERGVEAETLACGTGVTAAALVSMRLGWVRGPVHITCSSGDVLTVEADEKSEQVTLCGPAEFVYEGVIVYPEGQT